VAAEAASHYPVRIAVNPLADGDMASSVRVGRDSVAPENSGVIIALCDCPLVHPETVTGLMARHINVPDRVVIPSHAGRSGHPLLIPMPLLEELTDGLILRDLLRFNPDRIEYLEVTDPGILVDMDTPEDYQQVARMRASRT
jgi:molybdenum cofactor cytidylyltransferase